VEVRWFSGAGARLTTRPTSRKYKTHLTFSIGSKSLHTKQGKVLVRASFPSHGPVFALTRRINKFSFAALIRKSFHASSRFPHAPPPPPPASAFSLQAPAYKSFLLIAATIRASAGIPQAQLKERCGGCSTA
jgi:hypothetical protein